MRIPPPAAERSSSLCSLRPSLEKDKSGDAEGWRRHPGAVRFSARIPRPAGWAGPGVLPCRAEAAVPPQSGNLVRRDAHLEGLELGERPGAELILDLGRSGRWSLADYVVTHVIVDEGPSGERG